MDTKKKKKILLLSDDLRFPSGIGTMSQELVFGTLHEYDWCQMAGSVNHAEFGKIVDMSEFANKKLNTSGCYLKLYPCNGYGDEDMLFSVMEMEKPDAIVHFTDPRFWGWLYALEKQIRSKIPLTYINIWDNLPYPMYNRPFYECCDTLFSISKQTYNINKWVLGPENCIRMDGGYDSVGNEISF